MSVGRYGEDHPIRMEEGHSVSQAFIEGDADQVYTCDECPWAYVVRDVDDDAELRKAHEEAIDASVKHMRTVHGATGKWTSTPSRRR